MIRWKWICRIWIVALTYTKWDTFTECHIAWYGKTVEFKTVGNALKTWKKIFYLWKQKSKWFLTDMKTRIRTVLKLVASLTSGTEGNERCWFITKIPRLIVNKFDITSNKSDVVLTGRKRRRGTFMPGKKELLEFHFSLDSNLPWAPSKLLIAAPLAVSNWITLKPLSKDWRNQRNTHKDRLKVKLLTLRLTMISMWRDRSSTTRFIAGRLIHKLLVLKMLMK